MRSVLQWAIHQLPSLALVWYRSLFHGSSAARDLEILLDALYYRRNYPDVRSSRWPARWHYFLFGAAEKRNPHRWFDTAYYLALNPDVKERGINPLLHYVLYGAAEGRSPHPDFKALDSGAKAPGNPLVQSLLSSGNGPAHVWRGNGPAPARPSAPAAVQLSAESNLSAMAASRALLEELSSTRALVSVIIPCFNYGRYLWDALSSVLSQTYPHIEVLIIDDGSTDSETLQILDGIRHDRVRVIHQSNQGLAQSRNNGAAAARGQYLLYLDADDRLERNAVALLLYALERDSSSAYAYSCQRFFGDKDLVWAPQQFNAYDLMWSNHPSVCALMRRAALDDAGGYRPELLYGYEDWEFWIRLSSRGHHGLLVPAPVFEHRRHGPTMTEAAHERKCFLHSQILQINAAWYEPQSVTTIKRTWRPLVSVIIPFFNRAHYLKETLASLEAQTTRDFEVVIVNDGSDDSEGLRCLDEYRNLDWIRVLDCEHRGPAGARNAGALAARAELLLFLDSDDLLDPGALEKLCWSLSADREVDFVYSGVKHFGDIEAVCYDEFDPARLLRENYLTVTCVIRREVFLELGGHDPALAESHEDYDFWLRLVERGYKGKLFPEPLFLYRRHQGGLSVQRFRQDCGATESSAAVVKRHQTVRQRPAPLREPETHDPLLQRVTGALQRSVPETIPLERYRRPNVPNLFCPRNWSSSRATLLYLIPHFQLGGAEIFDLRILSCLPKERYRVVLVACERTVGPLEDEFKAGADEVFALERMGSSWAGRMAFLRYLMMSRSIDIVFNRNTLYGYELAANWRSVTEQVRYLDLLHLHAYGEDWVRASAPYHDKLDLRYVTSEDLPEYASSQYQLSNGRFQVLHYGLSSNDEIPTEEAQARLRGSLRERWGIDAEAFVVGFIGRLTDQKDPGRWLAVAARIARQCPSAVFLVVGGGEMVPELREQAAKLGVAETTVFTGYQRDAQHYCAAMDVLLLTSKYEGLPLVVLHALAHGTPVVSTDVGGIRWAVDERVGRIVPADATEAELARAVIGVREHLDRGEPVAGACRAHVTAQYSLDCMRRRLQEDLAALGEGLDRRRRFSDYALDLMSKPILT